MTEKQKYVLLQLVAGKSYSEIAREMGTSRQNTQQMAQAAIRIKNYGCKSNELNYYPVLIKALEDSDLSRYQFAKKLGIGYNTLRDMLKYGVEPRMSTWERIAYKLGMTVEELSRKE